MTTLAPYLRRGWSAIRSLFGDDAYERYVAHTLRRHPEKVPLERAAFHRAELDRRWSQINRCC